MSHKDLVQFSAVYMSLYEIYTYDNNRATYIISIKTKQLYSELYFQGRITYEKRGNW